jgi:hypothetical protein
MNKVFLLDRITHRDLHIPIKSLAQSKAMATFTLSSNQNPAQVKAPKSTDMLFSYRTSDRGRWEKELPVPCRSGRGMVGVGER